LYLKNRIIFFFISLFRFVFYFFPSIFFISVYFVLFSLISFCFRWFRFISFSFRWFRFVSFRSILHVCPLQYSSRTLPAIQFKPGLLADKLSEVQMSYFYLCWSVCQYLWIIKFLEWAYRKKGGIWGGIFKNRIIFFLFLYFVLYFIFFLPFSSYQSISFCFRWFRFAFVGFVLFRFQSTKTKWNRLILRKWKENYIRQKEINK
jgi:hypothetical protein